MRYHELRALAWAIVAAGLLEDKTMEIKRVANIADQLLGHFDERFLEDCDDDHADD